VSNLKEHSLKADFGAYLNPQNTIKFGLHTIQHQIAPGNIQSFENADLISEFVIQENKSWESALYVSHEIDVSNSLRVDYGLRVSMLQNVGPQKSFTLDENYEVMDTVEYNSGVYNTYFHAEPRLGIRYQLNEQNSVKLSYNRTAQYIQLASNGNTSTPFDVWFSSSVQVKPQLADQIAIGYFKMINGSQYEFSAELYYKKFKNAIDFKDHAQLLLNNNIEGELRFGKARAYGLELMLRKNLGRFTGWISYTYSKAEKKIDTVNNNEWYNAKHDKPHDLSIVGSYELSKRITIGSNFVYSTGNAVTFPTGKYEFRGKTIPVYSDRNGARLPDFHRLDFSLTLKSKKNQSRRFQSEWVFSVYNAYNRKNAFAINFKQEEANPNANYAVKESIFAIVPSVTYNAKF
jgi:outer membrane receptor for ferrienterochelin and colicin